MTITKIMMITTKTTAAAIAATTTTTTTTKCRATKFLALMPSHYLIFYRIHLKGLTHLFAE